MDSLDITSELNKINAIHSSLNEHNPLTYIIFMEGNREHLSDAQIEWIEERITKLENKESHLLEKSLSKIDVGLAMAPLSSKMEEHGVMKQLMDS